MNLDVSREALALEARASTMTPSELADARRDLYRSYVSGTRTTTSDAPTTRGGEVMEAALSLIESRMAVTAYDMAHPGSYTPLEGHPGYKEISEGELKDILSAALRNIPIGELPGGSHLAALVRTVPGTSSLDVDKMSFEELKDALGDTGKAYLDAQFKPFLMKHKVEAAVIGFGSITAIRAASPTAAGYLDKVLPGIEVWDGKIGPIDGEAELRYRDRRVLPDVDLSAPARHMLGGVELRATATGTIAIEADEKVVGRLEVGARTGSDLAFVDLSGSIDTEERASVLLRGRYLNPDERLIVRGDLGVTTGPHMRNGRADVTVSLDKEFNLDGGAVGSVGVYGSAGVDLDGKNADTRAGLMFRLRW